MVAFEASVVAIGVIGGFANLLMLLILAQSKARKYDMAIVFNQMTVDFLCCLQLVISNSVKILDIDYGASFGKVICKAFTSEWMIWYFLCCSTSNLVVLTLERYVKIVHAVFHKRQFRQWMYFVAIALAWINFETVLGAFVDLSATTVLNGHCVLYAAFPAAIDSRAYAAYTFLFNFILPLVVFVYCYSRILQVTRKRTVPVNFNNMMRSAAQQNAMKTQMNVIKTFLIISVCYVFCWSPTRFYFFLYNLRLLVNLDTDVRNITVFVAFLNVCLNPFIYAANLDPVKKFLHKKLCKRRRWNNEENATSVINVIGNSTAM